MSGSEGSVRPNEPNVEFMLGLSAERLATVAQALERNWMIQMILAGIGFALVFDLGDLPKFISRYVSQDTYDLKPAAAILLATLLFHFMKFGHLLTAFIEARHFHDGLLRQYLGSISDSAMYKPMRETTSYFDGYYSPQAFGGGQTFVAIYYFASAAIVSTAQAAALFLIVKAYGVSGGSIAAITIAVAIMAVLYREFWRSKRDQPGTTLLVVGTSAAVIALFVLFYAFGRSISPPPKAADNQVNAPFTPASTGAAWHARLE